MGNAEHQKRILGIVEQVEELGHDLAKVKAKLETIEHHANYFDLSDKRIDRATLVRVLECIKNELKSGMGA